MVNYSKRIIMVKKGADLNQCFSLVFVGKMCVSVSRPKSMMKPMPNARLVRARATTVTTVGAGTTRNASSSWRRTSNDSGCPEQLLPAPNWWRGNHLRKRGTHFSTNAGDDAGRVRPPAHSPVLASAPPFLSADVLKKCALVALHIMAEERRNGEMSSPWSGRRMGNVLPKEFNVGEWRRSLVGRRKCVFKRLS